VRPATAWPLAGLSFSPAPATALPPIVIEPVEQFQRGATGKAPLIVARPRSR